MPDHAPPYFDDSVLANTPWIERRRFTADEYQRMGETGILGPEERVELIEGEIICMSPIGSGHSGTSNWIARTLFETLGRRAVIASQNPVRVDDRSEPQPDFSVLRPRADLYKQNTPVPEDVLFLVEVSDSSLRYDRTVKSKLYARMGIREFWLVDLNAGTVDVMRAPSADGYGSTRVYSRDGAIEPELLPGVAISVADMLGEPLQEE